jgi:DNA replication protein DnaC
MDSLEKFAEWLKIKTFDDPELVKLVTGCFEWAQAFKQKNSPRWLSLLGVSGTGKTHCGRRLWDWARTRSDWSKCEYGEMSVYWPGFVQSLRAGNAFRMRDDMKRWPVLFLDDIGAERDATGFAAEELNTLLGYRMDRWTIITSNKDIVALKAIDARISSRLIRGQNISVGINTTDFSERI